MCRQFVVLCRDLKLFSQAVVAFDGSKFKAVNSRERNYTEGKIDLRQREIEANIQRYLDTLDPADRTLPEDWLLKGVRSKRRYPTDPASIPPMPMRTLMPRPLPR